MATFDDTGLSYITPLTIRSRERVTRTETLNLKVQAAGNDAQRWDLTLGLETTSKGGDSSAAGKLASHRAYHGLSRSFSTEMPQHLGSEPTISSSTASFRASAIGNYSSSTSYNKGVVVASGSDYYVSLKDNNASATSVTSNWLMLTRRPNQAGSEYVYGTLSSGQGEWKPGYFIRFTGHNKVYMVRQQVPSAPLNGKVLLEVHPVLHKTIPNNELIFATPSNPAQIDCYYSDSSPEGYTYSNGILQRATVSLVEAL